METLNFLLENLQFLWGYTGFANISWENGGNVLMTLIGCLFIYLAIAKHFEPMLLIPIGFGILVGNIPSLQKQDSASAFTKRVPY